MITGRTYLAKGQPVTVMAAWNGRYLDLPDLPARITLRGRVARCGPHNVLIERTDGGREVRPFRGLAVPRGAQ